MESTEVDIKITLNDFPYVCRACLNNQNLKALNDMLLGTFSKISDTQHSLGDDLPQNICYKCILKIEDIAAFSTLIKRNHDFFSRVLNESKCDILSEDIYVSDNALLSDDDNKEDETSTCAIIKEGTSSTPNSEVKLKTSKRASLAKCKACDEHFETKTQLTEHRKNNRDCMVKTFQCCDCGKSFSNKVRLKVHLRSHTKETPFECKICLKKFRHAPNLKRHDDIIHKGLKPYKCEICGKEFSRMLTKKEHLYTHTGEKPYVCSYCGETFSSYANYFAHTYLHRLNNGEVSPGTLKVKESETSNQLEVVCSICNKSFSSARAIFQHSHAKKQSEKQFLCTVCGKAFLRKHQLQTHSLLHTGEKPYLCKHCGKRFRHPSTYKSHVLMHLGKKPYQCEMCQKCFSQSEHLRQHRKTHTGERPHKCNFCGKKFAQKSNLVVHTRIHTGETPYLCSVCNKGFYDSSSMKKHEKGHVKPVGAKKG